MKLVRTVLQVEVLSNGRFTWANLDDVHESITHGDCSGRVTEISAEEVTPERMAELLLAQGSSPSFLLGEEWEDCDL